MNLKVWGPADAIVRALIPQTKVNTAKNIYIYLRFGIPMNENVGFSHVTALLSDAQQAQIPL